MKKQIIWIMTLLIGVVWSTPTMGQHLNKLTQKEKNEGWELLFDGHSMDKWRGYKKEKVQGWVIEEHAMKAQGLPHGQGGDIITKEVYKDFELYLEWKIGQRSNSGIFFHVVEGDQYPTVYLTGPEYQLLDDVGFPESDPLHDSGANYDMHPAKFGQVKTLDEWNTARIIVKGPHVEHYLNGRKVVEYDLWTDDWYKLKNGSKWKNAEGYGKYKEGHIALQDHGGTTMFRNIKIRRL
ncbi:MAG: DUF1080 domain-containing protein [Bacteroidales bacterium]|nr:DUF1080 domain-containing protein [Bacteroidales bacterium]